MTRKPNGKKQTAHGASSRRRQPIGSNSGLRTVLKVCVALSLVVGLGAAFWLTQHTVGNMLARPIGLVSVEGQFTHIKEAELRTLVSPMISNGFLKLPLQDVKAALEENPWVATAAVARRWPDELSISIVEEQPIARWREQGFVNQYGKVIEVGMSRQLENLPLLIGRNNQATEVMSTYVALNQLLRSEGLYISELECDELQSWRLRFNNGLALTIGRDNVMGKVQRFITAYQQALKPRVNEIARIDLRYDNGLAVAWRDAEAAVALRP